jgi:hypothetical protein
VEKHLVRWHNALFGVFDFLRTWQLNPREYLIGDLANWLDRGASGQSQIRQQSRRLSDRSRRMETYGSERDGYRGKLPGTVQGSRQSDQRQHQLQPQNRGPIQRAGARTIEQRAVGQPWPAVGLEVRNSKFTEYLVTRCLPRLEVGRVLVVLVNSLVKQSHLRFA